MSTLSCTVPAQEATPIPATGHSFTNWSVVQEAAPGVAGRKERTCRTCSHVETEVIPAINPFSDVKSTDYYFDSVLWAVTERVTSGMTTTTTFAPTQNCTRAQVVTFLYRANGEPAVSGTNPFTDVKSTDYFYNAVLWAVSEGITTGMSATEFAPDMPCTRAQVVTFLWRDADKPTPSSNQSFSDVAAGQYYRDAVLWAVGEGITNGMGNNRFAPNDTCTRGQIVTFLYRAFA